MNLLAKSMKKMKSHTSKTMMNMSVFVLSGMTSLAHASGQGGDIIATLIQGSIGKTLSKDGLIWGVLSGASFLIGAFWAALKHDPKAFIPAFLISAIISTITGMFLTF